MKIHLDNTKLKRDRISKWDKDKEREREWYTDRERDRESKIIADTSKHTVLERQGQRIK